MTTLATPTMAFDEAKQLTEQIRAGTLDLWKLIVRAHDERAWAALSYPGFGEYVRQEFSMSRAKAYRLLDYGHLQEALSHCETKPGQLASVELAKLETPAEQTEAWQEAVETTKGKPRTIDVEAVVEKKVRAKRNGAAPVEHAPAVPLEQALQEPTSSVEDAVWQIDFNAEHASPAQLEEAISHLFQRLAPRKKLLVIVRLFHELATEEREQFGKLMEASK